jgi:putative ABC transport system ATP-binding protein
MIELRHITKRYGDSAHAVTALHDVSLSVAHGEFVAVAGASGAGKSTLLQIVGCLDVPTSGHYELDGESVEGKDDRQLSDLRSRMIGFVFQQFNLIPRTTARENVETPLLYSDRPQPPRRALDLLARVGLAHRADHFPNQLSGGEQQRVAIARALVLQPALLIADEPTGNLDADTGEQILSLLSSLHGDGMTILLVTHDPVVARRAQRVVTMSDGRIVETVRGAATAVPALGRA